MLCSVHKITTYWPELQQLYAAVALLLSPCAIEQQQQEKRMTVCLSKMSGYSQSNYNESYFTSACFSTDKLCATATRPMLCYHMAHITQSFKAGTG
jgi:hypothetical protein